MNMRADPVYYDREQIAQVKRKLIDADYVVALASGEQERISKETGVNISTIRQIIKGNVWRDVEPAL